MKKKFDCVKMKWDIQQELAKEYEALSNQNIWEKQAEKIAKNPILKKFLKKSVSPSRSPRKEMIGA